eukprot:scaffold818_cov136-Cylindrotheca_fusiformis.AAC.2
MNDGLGGCYEGPVRVSGCDTTTPTLESPSFVEAEYANIKGVFSAGVDSLMIKYPGYPAVLGEMTRTLYSSEDAAEQVLQSKCTNGVSEVTVTVRREGADCEHTIVVPCRQQDMCSTVASDGSDRRLVNEEASQQTTEPSQHTMVDKAMEAGPYCESQDFPCEGEGDEMVHVCHYSTLHGYKTYCIPEADSELLRFYENDYCGPCVDGFGTS